MSSLCACRLFVAATTLAGAANAGTISGVVAFEDGSPAAGALVVAARALGYGQTAMLLTMANVGVKTGADGGFAIDTPGDGHFTVKAALWDYAPASAEIDVDQAPAEPIRLTLSRTSPGTGSISGLVRSAQTGEPAPYAVVVLTQNGNYVDLQLPTMDRMASTRADQDGRFFFHDIAPSEYGVELDGPLFVREPVPVTVAADDWWPDLVVDGVMGAEVRCRVLASDGVTPLASRRVALHETNFIRGSEQHNLHIEETDARGVITRPGMGPWRMQIAASLDEEHHGEYVELTAAPEQKYDIDLVVPAESSLDGLVTDELTGKPVEDALVMIGFEDGPSMTTGADGRFSLKPVYVGPQHLYALAPGYAAYHQEIEVSPEVFAGARGVGQITFVRLSPGATVAGRVIDSDSRPVAGAAVVLHSFTHFALPAGERAKEYLEATSDEDGVYLFRCVPMAKVAVLAVRWPADRPHPPMSCTFRNVTGEEARVDITALVDGAAVPSGFRIVSVTKPEDIDDADVVVSVADGRE